MQSAQSFTLEQQVKDKDVDPVIETSTSTKEDVCTSSTKTSPENDLEDVYFSPKFEVDAILARERLKKEMETPKEQHGGKDTHNDPGCYNSTDANDSASESPKRFSDTDLDGVYLSPKIEIEAALAKEKRKNAKIKKKEENPKKTNESLQSSTSSSDEDEHVASGIKENRGRNENQHVNKSSKYHKQTIQTITTVEIIETMHLEESVSQAVNINDETSITSSESSTSASLNDEYIISSKQKHVGEDGNEISVTSSKPKEHDIYDENNYCLARSTSLISIDDPIPTSECKDDDKSVQKGFTKNQKLVCKAIGGIFLAGIVVVLLIVIKGNHICYNVQNKGILFFESLTLLKCIENIYKYEFLKIERFQQLRTLKYHQRQKQ